MPWHSLHMYYAFQAITQTKYYFVRSSVYIRFGYLSFYVCQYCVKSLVFVCNFIEIQRRLFMCMIIKFPDNCAILPQSFSHGFAKQIQITSPCRELVRFFSPNQVSNVNQRKAVFSFLERRIKFSWKRIYVLGKSSTVALCASFILFE